MAPNSVFVRGLGEAASVSPGHFVVDIIEAGPREISGEWTTEPNAAVYTINEEVERSDSEVVLNVE